MSDDDYALLEKFLRYALETGADAESVASALSATQQRSSDVAQLVATVIVNSRPDWAEKAAHGIATKFSKEELDVLYHLTLQRNWLMSSAS
jgi:hypothetical protein